MQQPICITDGCNRATDQVDHILPVMKYPRLAFRRSSLQGLCTPCHARKSAEERRSEKGFNP